jgi:hypothetical protein
LISLVRITPESQDSRFRRAGTRQLGQGIRDRIEDRKAGTGQPERRVVIVQKDRKERSGYSQNVEQVHNSWSRTARTEQLG